jgi:hypothetical protein
MESLFLQTNSVFDISCHRYVHGEWIAHVVNGDGVSVDGNDVVFGYW